MSLSQSEKTAIHKKVENMTSKERKAKLNGYVREFFLKTIAANIVLIGYGFFSFYLNHIYDLNLFVVALQIIFGVILVRICMILHESFLFFRNANNIVKSFNKGVDVGFKHIDKLSEND